MRENDYQYMDPEDRITSQNIRRIELYPGYWEKSENKILNIVKNLLKIKAGHKRFLDAGCGEGRLIPIFEGQFDEVVAIDPDPERLRVAAELIHNLGLSDKIKLKQSAIESFEDGKFDFILCSHVLQHVHTGSLHLIINKIRYLIEDNGLLCITTCHSIKNKEYFVKESISDPDHLEETIDEMEFNSLVNSNGILPVHFFTFKNINNLLDDCGFKIVEFRVFHLDKRIVGYENDERIDDAANMNQARKEITGRDMMIAAMPIGSDWK
jgi:SAM-dependent methyltransferase